MDFNGFFLLKVIYIVTRIIYPKEKKYCAHHTERVCTLCTHLKGFFLALASGLVLFPTLLFPSELLFGIYMLQFNFTLGLTLISSV